jgi:hypothetical protein
VDKAVVGLADAIEALRAELTKAIDKGKDKRMRFSIEPIELSIQVGVTKDASGKVGWMVLEVGGSFETATTQTLTLRLAPLWQLPDGTVTSSPTIASAGEAGDRFGEES